MDKSAPPFRIFDSQGNEIPILNCTSECAKRNAMPFPDCYLASGSFGEILFGHASAGEFKLGYSKYNINQNTTINGTADVPVIELHIAYRNYFECRWDGVTSAECRRAGQFNISYTPCVNTQATFLADKKYETFDVHISRSFLEQLAPSFPLVAGFLDKIDKKQPADLSPGNRFCSNEMMAVIHQILHSPFSGKLRKSLLVHQLSELVITAVALLSKPPAERKRTLFLFSDDERARLNDLKSMIEDTVGKIPITKRLSQNFIMTGDKMRAGFKILFGTTIFTYHRQIKLERARVALLESCANVSDIAFNSGYQDASGFITKFKKKYGCTPGYYREHGHREEE